MVVPLSIWYLLLLQSLVVVCRTHNQSEREIKSESERERKRAKEKNGCVVFSVCRSFFPFPPVGFAFFVSDSY